MDGDGDSDILTLSSADSDLVWWENLDGEGTDWETHIIAASYDPDFVLAADLDGEGDLDLVAASDTSGKNDLAAWPNSRLSETTYGYNPSGQRVKQTILDPESAQTKTWTYSGTAIATEHSTADDDIHKVYTVLGGVALERHDIDLDTGGTPTPTITTASRYYLYNHRGDVIGVTDADGQLLTAVDYDAYGALTQTSGADLTDDILLTGKNLDPVTRLYYFNARWYDPETGRFISETPLTPDEEEPYAICFNNPINFIDWNGLAPKHSLWDSFWGGVWDGPIVATVYQPVAHASEGYGNSLYWWWVGKKRIGPGWIDNSLGGQLTEINASQTARNICTGGQVVSGAAVAAVAYIFAVEGAAAKGLLDTGAIVAQRSKAYEAFFARGGGRFYSQLLTREAVRSGARSHHSLFTLTYTLKGSGEVSINLLRWAVTHSRPYFRHMRNFL